MQISNDNQNSRPNDPVWQFLAEYSLSEFLLDHDKGGERTTGLLFQTMRDLGIPPEYLENIEMTLTGFTKATLLHFKQRSLELPGRIRVFCHRKMIEDANSAKTSRPDYAEQTVEHAPIKYQFSTIINGGWGYFIIEKSDDDARSPERTRPFVELYVYREGE